MGQCDHPAQGIISVRVVSLDVVDTGELPDQVIAERDRSLTVLVGPLKWLKCSFPPPDITGCSGTLKQATRKAKILRHYQGGPISPNSSKMNARNHIIAIIQPITQTTFRSKCQVLHISTKHAIVNMAVHIIPMGRNRLVHNIQLVAVIDHMHIFASTLRVRSSTNLRGPFIAAVLFRMPKHTSSLNAR
ncbi:hypothetical protein THTE_4077 [Thermogutta terrifontis]|uniref:Uncharacterized protein n=1 Tax=Thermogutta terrifontis TaxID=1331910 RepID=A0A286RL58_9BACT|nr:hypothetical protein THTE_4077 [Thermogutta terrifontis]